MKTTAGLCSANTARANRRWTTTAKPPCLKRSLATAPQQLRLCYEGAFIMWPRIHVALAVLSLCSGCAYDAGDRYAQMNQPYGYAPGGYVPRYAYGYSPSYDPPGPSLGFGYFGGGDRNDNWHTLHNHGGDRAYRGDRPRGGLNGPPPAAPAARSVPSPAANAAALDRLGFRPNP